MIVQLLIKPVEWFVYLLACLSCVMLWLCVASTPFFVFAVLGLIGFAADEVHGLYWLYTGLVTGCLLGTVYAEWIRRKYGCIEFMGKLLSTPEIEGWRTAEQQCRKSRERRSR
ncbi:MAG: hypothetical protein MJK04_37920 [Psychrosphaera sp.]|nr:hypothetical protein [Psychrosphaera sp.]